MALAETVIHEDREILQTLAGSKRNLLRQSFLPAWLGRSLPIN